MTQNKFFYHNTVSVKKYPVRPFVLSRLPPLEKWNAGILARHKFPVSDGDLQLSDNYGYALVASSARSTPRHQADILSWLRTSLWSRIDVDEEGEGVYGRSRNRKAKRAPETTQLFRRYKRELWSIYVAMDAKGPGRAFPPVCVIFFCSVTAFPLSFFSSSFRSCLPFRVARCPLERAVVTFEICWEKEEVG